jgi:hypothetical protein
MDIYILAFLVVIAQEVKKSFYYWQTLPATQTSKSEKKEEKEYHLQY